MVADETETTSESMPISEIVRRSSLGTGCYVIRDEDIATRILDAVVEAGACAVGHDAVFDQIVRGQLCLVALSMRSWRPTPLGACPSGRG